MRRRMAEGLSYVQSISACRLQLFHTSSGLQLHDRRLIWNAMAMCSVPDCCMSRCSACPMLLIVLHIESTAI